MSDESTCTTNWIRELLDEVKSSVDELAASESDLRPALQQERDSLISKKKGWLQSLAKRDLAECIRSEIESEWQAAEQRLTEIEAELAELNSARLNLDQQISTDDVLLRLERLPDILARNDPTAGNLELSLHIDRIECNSEGNVQLKMCKLGVLPEAIDLLAAANTNSDQHEKVGDAASKKSVPRRRGRLKVDSLAPDSYDVISLTEFAADTNRFAGLSDDWFWVDEFQLPGKRSSWAEANAPRVAELRKQGKTEEKIAEELGVSIATVRKSLRIAEKNDPELAALPGRMPRPRWHEEHALEVARVKAEEGLGTNELVARFGKSDTTIRKALEHAEKLQARAAAL